MSRSKIHRLPSAARKDALLKRQHDKAKAKWVAEWRAQDQPDADVRVYSKPYSDAFVVILSGQATIDAFRTAYHAVNLLEHIVGTYLDEPDLLRFITTEAQVALVAVCTRFKTSGSSACTFTERGTLTRMEFLLHPTFSMLTRGEAEDAFKHVADYAEQSRKGTHGT